MQLRISLLVVVLEVLDEDAKKPEERFPLISYVRRFYLQVVELDVLVDMVAEDQKNRQIQVRRRSVRT